INRLDIKINDTDSKNKDFEDEYIVIAIDSTGIKVTNRGQWMKDKWNVKKKKGYLKIHIATVNVKSKKILSIKVTDEHVHDSKALPQLVDDIIKSDRKLTIGKLFADGAYDGNDIFRCRADNGILPCIKVRKNAKVRLKKGHILRNLSVISQRNDLQKWTDSIVSYGKRWIVETVFSAIKRMFDREYVYSVRLKNMIQEMMLKASLYNKMISI
ncbi:MAG: IS5 family transposase, partial [Candidatus Nitrosocosmicus sp.]